MLKSSLITTLLVLIMCGLVYPLVTTAVGQTFFHHQANGSLIEEHGKVVGSSLIGQEFTSPVYLHGRPSAHHYSSYNVYEKKANILPVTGGTNYSNTNPELLDRVATDRKIFSKENGIPAKDVPVNILTASGSGLDNAITKQAADMQIKRIAKHSGLTKQQIQFIINQHTERHSEMNTVNVLAVNLDIKKLMDH